MTLAPNLPAPEDDGDRRRALRRRTAAKERLTALHPAPDAEAGADTGPETRPNVVLDPADLPAELSVEAVEQLDVEVRRVEKLRPVPPVQRPAPARPAAEAHRIAVPAWPVYDPYAQRRRQSPEWLVSHTATLVVVDSVLAAAADVVAMYTLGGGFFGWRYVVAAAVLWPALLALVGAYAERRLGAGADEFRRVALAGLIATSGAAVVSAARNGILDWCVLVAVPLATVLTLLGRGVNRWRLHRARRQGEMTKSVVVVGREGAVVDLVRRIRRDATAGLRVVGACVPRPHESTRLVADGIPVLGGLGDVVRVIDQVRAESVLVASTSESAGGYLRQLAWRLEGTGIDVLVGPGVIEVAPSRLQVRPTASMPLIQIREPEFRGHRRVLKTLLDKLVAAVVLLLTSPAFAVIAVAIKVTSPGPVLFRHRRIGKRGREFTLYKFRSMTVDAPSDVELMAHNEGNEVQFKMRRDPRVTAIGRVLRRYSIDELPQLLNVLKGEMSLVGPRPHVTREVEQYGPDMHRRLLVKPGLTGLWQVSGRSDLSWDEAVELDTRYVENWSIGMDLWILWRTVRAVLRSSGAY
ncbi:sugar transferase [Geodermatophilus sp. SYSU D00691]